MVHWPEFAQRAPAIAAAGRRLLYRPDGGEIALLATVDARGAPRIAPVCPIFAPAALYVLASARTPKTAHLAANGTYALHAQVGADDTEFQISGVARRVLDPAERDVAIDAIRFPQFDPSDPIFELLVGHALLVTWPSPGRRDVVRWRDDDA